MSRKKLSYVILALMGVSLLVVPFALSCDEETPTELASGDVYEGMYTYDDFEEPTTCGECHIDIYADWSVSLMGTQYVKEWKQVEYFQLAYPQ